MRLRHHLRSKGLLLAGVALENPLGDNVSLNDIIGKLIAWLTGIIGLLALAALVWAGFRMITAFGNDKQVAEAKTIIFWAIIGLVVVLVAYVVIQTVSKAFGVT